MIIGILEARWIFPARDRPGVPNARDTLQTDKPHPPAQWLTKVQPELTLAENRERLTLDPEIDAYSLPICRALRFLKLTHERKVRMATRKFTPRNMRRFADFKLWQRASLGMAQNSLTLLWTGFQLAAELVNSMFVCQSSRKLGRVASETLHVVQVIFVSAGNKLRFLNKIR